MRIKVLKGVYPPSEDTFFLASLLEKTDLRGKHVLDLGTGTGYLAVLSALKGARVTAADLLPRAILNARLNARLNGVRFRTVLSDLFEHVKGRYDVIVFNPPYLIPWEEVNDPAWDGGPEIILRFLGEVGDHLTETGTFLTVMEEGVWGEVKDRFSGFEVNTYRNAFHLVAVEGRACP